jgi:hypothetical protein
MANDGVHGPDNGFSGGRPERSKPAQGSEPVVGWRRHRAAITAISVVVALLVAGGLWVFAGGLGLAVGGEGRSATGVQTAPDPTSPGQVVDAYLTAFRVGDCDEGGRWTSESFPGNGDLCGFVTIDDYTVNGAATPTPDQQVFAVDLHVTKGSADGTVPEGEVTWFYQLNRQADGTWKIIGGGSGP